MNYLYNGVELPDINTVYTPELQKTHPYAVLVNGFRAGLYVLYLDDGTPYLATNSSGEVYLAHDGQGHKKVFYDVAKDTEWRDMTGGTTGSTLYIERVFWTSHDILNEDGSVYLAASDPIPVGGAEPIDPETMLMGWLVGRRIAGQRNKHDPVSAESD